MNGLDVYRGKSHMLLGFLLLVSYVLLVKTIEYSNLDATPLSYEHSGAATPGAYSLSSSKSAFPIDPAVTWMANRNTQRDNIWCTFTDNMDVVSASAKLQNSGNLELQNVLNGTVVCPISRFDDHSPPTDMLLPGQRSQGGSLVSWQRNGNPEIVNDIYSFGWDAKRVSTLYWTCLEVFFDRRLESYIGSKPPTAILSGRQDPVSNTTLTRLTMCLDGGLRNLGYNQINRTLIPGQASNQHWNAVANWVVSDRPDLPTAALHGTNRTAYMRKQAAKDIPKPPPPPPPAKKDNKWVKILAPAVGILGVLLIIAVAILCLRRYENVWQWLRACGPCCWRPTPRYQIEFPGDMPKRTEPGDDGVELQVDERGPARCHCAVSCVMSCSPRI